MSCRAAASLLRSMHVPLLCLALPTLLRLSKYITIGKRTGLMLCIYVIVCKCYYVIEWVIKL